MSIETWMPELKSVMEGVTGIEQVHVYNDLPGTLAVFPCLVIMPTRGGTQYGMSAPGVSVHQVQMTLYVAMQVLPEANGLAVPFIKLVRDELAANVTLGGTVAYVLPPGLPADFYEGPGEIAYGDKKHVGIIFHIVVKENETITVTP